jgi:NAD(P)-dependent dehydrogenase (short-subunit alcohol dehydrogenase family)
VAGDLKLDGLQETERPAGGTLVGHVCDVRSAETVHQLVSAAEERFGGLFM